jgi:hypothetical protein
MTEKETGTSAWTIAGGVLIALLALRACDRYEQNRAIEAYNAEIAKVFDPVEQERRARVLFPQVAEARERMIAQNAQRQREAHRAAEAAAIKSNERCIGKQRFRRVANGWEQIGSC